MIDRPSNDGRSTLLWLVLATFLALSGCIDSGSDSDDPDNDDDQPVPEQPDDGEGEDDDEDTSNGGGDDDESTSDPGESQGVASYRESGAFTDIGIEFDRDDWDSIDAHIEAIDSAADAPVVAIGWRIRKSIDGGDTEHAFRVSRFDYGDDPTFETYEVTGYGTSRIGGNRRPSVKLNVTENGRIHLMHPKDDKLSGLDWVSIAFDETGDVAHWETFARKDHRSDLRAHFNDQGDALAILTDSTNDQGEFEDTTRVKLHYLDGADWASGWESAHEVTHASDGSPIDAIQPCCGTAGLAGHVFGDGSVVGVFGAEYVGLEQGSYFAVSRDAHGNWGAAKDVTPHIEWPGSEGEFSNPLSDGTIEVDVTGSENGTWALRSLETPLNSAGCRYRLMFFDGTTEHPEPHTITNCNQSVDQPETMTFFEGGERFAMTSLEEHPEGRSSVFYFDQLRSVYHEKDLSTGEWHTYNDFKQIHTENPQLIEQDGQLYLSHRARFDTAPDEEQEHVTEGMTLNKRTGEGRFSGFTDGFDSDEPNTKQRLEEGKRGALNFYHMSAGAVDASDFYVFVDREEKDDIAERFHFLLFE